MLQNLSRLLRRSVSNIPAKRSSANRRRTRYPRFEVLEGRLALSTLTVTSSDDIATQAHTLRYAVEHAQDGDTILLTAAIKEPIVLTQGELVLNENVTIKSVPSRTPTISGGGISRVFEVAADAHVSLVNMKITNGNGVSNNPTGSAQFDNSGGAILNLGELTVSDCIIFGNSTTYGGGFNVLFGATLTVNNSTVSGNSASEGGGINVYYATLTVNDSTVSENSAGYRGGAISAFYSGLTVANSSLLSNSAYLGGGIALNASSATLSSSTLAGNTATGFGGGIWVDNWVTMTIDASTFSGNSALIGGGAIFQMYWSSLWITGSTFSGNSAGSYAGAIFSYYGELHVGTSHFSGNTPGAIVTMTGYYDDMGGNTFEDNPLLA